MTSVDATSGLHLRWVDVSLDVPRADVRRAAGFWAAATGGHLSPWRDDGRFVTVVPPAGRPVLRLQAVDDGPVGWHPDLRVGDPERAVAHARARGARVVGRRPGVVVLATPGGQPLCVTGDGEGTGDARPDPTGEPPTRVDQLALDLPPDRAEVDAAFWAGLTGWERVVGRRPELAVLRPEGFGAGPAPQRGVPVRLLLHSLGEDERGRAPWAHLDLAAGSDPAVRRRAVAAHVALGATVVRDTPGWTVLVDPVGATYCLTGRDPLTGAVAPVP
ncbi:VOC family protein [Lapillicoccus jejuensis]|uniref:Glyoxalase-like domain-containing protein n=1 Tax=Lapillicoccus jejuensis TaxID=402171 RepID=A0A542DWL6_9MICO|nr:VOC family protein [Lapillicoccus jejuensis]TQJ07490.1 hypothetical protein FB458_0552 [Lapillicoccus jejuensis]